MYYLIHTNENLWRSIDSATGQVMVEHRWKKYLRDEVLVYSEYSDEYVPLEYAVHNKYLKQWFSTDCGLVHTEDGEMPQDLAEERCYMPVANENMWYHEDNTFYCEISEEVYSDREPAVRTYCGMIAHEDVVRDDYHYIERGDARGTWLYYEDATYCEDINEYVHRDDAEYDEYSDAYYYDLDNAPCHGGDDHINSYHDSPSPTKIFGGNKYFIGFEIEKIAFEVNGSTLDEKGDYVGACDFFSGYETDSSCGVEAISNIFPLDQGEGRFKTFVAMHDNTAQQVIGSPVNSSCGGHMSVSVEDMSSRILYVRLSNYAGLLYAMFRYRLTNSYCRNNNKLEPYDNTKYSPIHLKSNCVEIRIPNRVVSVSQLKNRYDIMYHIVDAAVNDTPFNEFMDKVTPLLYKIYSGSVSKVQLITELAHDFQQYILKETITTKISDYVCNND